MLSNTARFTARTKHIPDVDKLMTALKELPPDALVSEAMKIVSEHTVILSAQRSVLTSDLEKAEYADDLISQTWKELTQNLKEEVSNSHGAVTIFFEELYE